MVAPVQGSSSVTSTTPSAPASSATPTGNAPPTTASTSTSGANYGYADASGMNPAAASDNNQDPTQSRFAHAKAVSHQLFSHHELRTALAAKSTYKMWHNNRTLLAEGRDVTSRASLLREWSDSLPPGKLTKRVAEKLADGGEWARGTPAGSWLGKISNQGPVADRLNAVMDKKVGLELDSQRALAERTNTVLDQKLAQRFPDVHGKTLADYPLSEKEQQQLMKESRTEASRSFGKDIKDGKAKLKGTTDSEVAKGLKADVKVASKAKSAGGFFGWLKTGMEKVGKVVGDVVEGTAKLASRIPVVGETAAKAVRFAGKAVGSPLMLAVNGVMDTVSAVKAFANPNASWGERLAAVGAVGADAVGIGSEVIAPGNPVGMACMAGSFALGMTRDTLHDKAEK